MQEQRRHILIVITQISVMLVTSLLHIRNGVSLPHCCIINHIQNQSPVTKIPVMHADEQHSSQPCCTKFVSASTEYKPGETAIEQLLAEEESARAKTASKKAKRQRQQQKKRTQASLNKAGLADPPVQPESTDHYITSDTLASPVTDTGHLQADSETCQSSSPSQPGSMQTGSYTGSSSPTFAHMTVSSAAVQHPADCADTKLTVSASACMPSMSEASQDQLAPAMLQLLRDVQKILTARITQLSLASTLLASKALLRQTHICMKKSTPPPSCTQLTVETD